jgi:hypothetical protein
MHPKDKRSRFAARKLRDQGKRNRPAAGPTTTTTPVPASLLSPGLPFAEALQGLLTLTEMMRSMRAPDGTTGSVEPMIILSPAGIEMRMAASEPVQGRPQQTGGKLETPPPDWLARIETSLEAVRQSSTKLQESVTRDVRRLEETLQSQAESIETMRTALAQNEQLVESIVESLSAGDGGNAGALGTLGDLGDMSLDEPADAPLSF